MKKFKAVVLGVVLGSSLLPGLNVGAEEINYGTKAQFLEEKVAIEDALDRVLAEANEEIAEGSNDIYVEEYVEEIGENVSVEFHTGVATSQKVSANKTGMVTLAALPSGRKPYQGKVSGGSFTHTLLGEFVYSGGKVTSATKEVRASGATFSHTRTASITKLDPSVWSVHSTSQHKWLGTVGGVTGLGYTSYITVELYGSGTAALKRATYKTGV